MKEHQPGDNVNDMNKWKNPVRLAIDAARSNKWVIIVGGPQSVKDKIVRTLQEIKAISNYNPCYKISDLDGYSGSFIYKKAVEDLKYFRNHLSSTDTLFLDSLCCKSKEDIKALRKLAGYLRDLRFKNRHCLGTFILGVESKEVYDRLPNSLQIQFCKPIYLSEQEKSNLNQELWSIDKKKLEVYYNCKGTKYPIKLTPLQFCVFHHLYKAKNKYVKVSTLQKCWKIRPSYKNFVSDCISKIKIRIISVLKKHKIKSYGDIIKSDHPKKTKA